LIQIFGSGF